MRDVRQMKRVVGFISLWVAVGMSLMLLISNRFVGVLLIIFFVLVGYRLFCC